MPFQVRQEDTLPKEHTNSLKKPQAPAVPEDDGFTRYTLIKCNNGVTSPVLVNSGAKDFNICTSNSLLHKNERRDHYLRKGPKHPDLTNPVS